MIAGTVQQYAQNIPILTSLVVPDGPLGQYKKEIEGLVPKLTKKFKFIASKKDIQDTMSTLHQPRYEENDLQCSVSLTWQISFNQIRLQRPKAANLLSLLGTLRHEAVPAELLVRASIHELDYQEDIGILVQE